jgi:DNA-binding MarR family transcriptional regulator
VSNETASIRQDKGHLAAPRNSPDATGPSPRERREQTDVFVTALLAASRALVGVSVRSLAELHDTVTLPQFRTLVALESHGVTNLNRLARVLDVNASSAVRMIDRLLAAGLVTRKENPRNRRQVLLEVTPAGAEIVRRVVARRRREITRIVAAIPETLRDDLVAALTEFSAAAERLNSGAGDEISALGW